MKGTSVTNNKMILYSLSIFYYHKKWGNILHSILCKNVDGLYVTSLSLIFSIMIIVKVSSFILSLLLVSYHSSSVMTIVKVSSILNILKVCTVYTRTEIKFGE